MSLYGTGRLEACLAVGVLAVLAFVAQAPALLGYTTAAPPSGEAAVTSSVFLPAIADAAAVLAQGEWPWWNPFARLGEPFTVSGLQPLYPGFWPLLWFGIGALPTVMALHGALASLLMYRFVRAQPTSRFVAFLGGGLWGLGWFFQAQLDRLPEAAACAWLPLCLESLWRLTRPGNRRGATAALAVGVAAMVMTGGFAVTRVALLALGLMTAWNIQRLGASDRLATLGSLAIGGLGALLLCAPAWLDWLQFAAVLEPADPLGTPLPAGAVWGVLSPTLLSSDALHELGPRLVARESLALALFPGTATLLFAVMGFVRPSPAQPRWPWLTLAALGLYLSVDAPGAGFLRDATGLASARPGATLLLLHLGLLVLACNGLNAFLDAPYRRPVAIPLLATASVLSAGAAAGALLLQPELSGGALLGWLGGHGVDAIEAAAAVARRALLPTTSVLLLLGLMFLVWRRMGVLRFKQALAAVVLAEVLTFATLESARRPLPAAPLDTPVAQFDLAAPGRVLALDAPSLAAMTHGAVRVRGINRSGDSILVRSATFLDEVAPGALHAGERIHAALPARVALSPGLAALAQIQPVPDAYAALGDPHVGPPPTPGGARPVPVGPLPWARLVFDAEHADGPELARLALHALAATPERVLLEGAEPGKLAADAAASVQVLARGANTTHLRVDARTGNGWLLVAEAHAPGWQATLDGKPAPLAIANLTFQAIAIPPGAHEVTLEYRPWAASTGLALAFAGALLCIALIALEQRRPPRQVELSAPRILKKPKRHS